MPGRAQSARSVHPSPPPPPLHTHTCALSSNSELAQAGPLPSWLMVYGLAGAEPPQMLLQPVALAMTMRVPNIWQKGAEVPRGGNRGAG